MVWLAVQPTAPPLHGYRVRKTPAMTPPTGAPAVLRSSTPLSLGRELVRHPTDSLPRNFIASSLLGRAATAPVGGDIESTLWS